jgi:hypothetical protein
MLLRSSPIRGFSKRCMLRRVRSWRSNATLGGSPTTAVASRSVILRFTCISRETPRTRATGVQQGPFVCDADGAAPHRGAGLGVLRSMLLACEPPDPVGRRRFPFRSRYWRGTSAFPAPSAHSGRRRCRVVPRTSRQRRTHGFGSAAARGRNGELLCHRLFAKRSSHAHRAQ